MTEEEKQQLEILMAKASKHCDDHSCDKCLLDGFVCDYLNPSHIDRNEIKDK